MTPPPSPTCHHHLLSNFEVLPCIVARNVTLLRSHWGSIAPCREALPRLMGADLGPENRRGLQGRCPKLEVPCGYLICLSMFIHGIWSFNFFNLVYLCGYSGEQWHSWYFWSCFEPHKRCIRLENWTMLCHKYWVSTLTELPSKSWTNFWNLFIKEVREHTKEHSNGL